MIEKEHQFIEWKESLQDIKVNKENIEDENYLEDIVELFRNLNMQILAARKNVSRKELENLLDWLVSSSISDDVMELFKKVCRHFYYQYPEVITDYVLVYKELYADE